MQGVGLVAKKKKKKKTQSIKQKQYCNKFNKDFKNGSHQKNLKKTKNLALPLTSCVALDKLRNLSVTWFL